MMKKQRKVLLLTVLCVMTLTGIVYAAFTALTLKVNTTATAAASIFSFGFGDVQPFVEKTNDDITVNVQTPTQGDQEVTLSVSGLKKPGDTASVYYTVVNSGDVDATDIEVYVGPDRQLEQGQSPNVWTSEDGVFEFSTYKTNYDGSDVNSSVGANWVTEENELKPGEIGVVKIEVKLLKMVDTDTSASCTAKITANPGNLDVEQ